MCDDSEIKRWLYEKGEMSVVRSSTTCLMGASGGRYGSLVHTEECVLRSDVRRPRHTAMGAELLSGYKFFSGECTFPVLSHMSFVLR